MDSVEFHQCEGIFVAGIVEFADVTGGMPTQCEEWLLERFTWGVEPFILAVCYVHNALKDVYLY